MRLFDNDWIINHDLTSMQRRIYKIMERIKNYIFVLLLLFLFGCNPDKPKIVLPTITSSDLEDVLGIATYNIELSDKDYSIPTHDFIKVALLQMQSYAYKEGFVYKPKSPDVNDCDDISKDSDFFIRQEARKNNLQHPIAAGLIKFKYNQQQSHMAIVYIVKEGSKLSRVVIEPQNMKKIELTVEQWESARIML